MINLLRKQIKTPTSLRYFHSYLLKNGQVVNSDWSETADVLIQNGKITNIGQQITHKTAQVFDCSNKLIIPGGIDPHTHMQLPFMGASAMDDFDIGTKAALSGGTTSFIDFALPNKGQSLSDAFERWRGWADPKVNSDYALHCGITEWNQKTKDQMKRMVQKGVTSFKFFMAYNGALRIDDIGMYHAFETARDLGAICMVHAQNGDLIEMNTNKLIKMGITGPEGHYLSRKEYVQAEAVHRVIAIAQSANVPLYIVHIMSKQASQEVMRAKNRGLLVYAQTLASTLGSDGTKLWDKNWDIASRYVMSPCLSPDPTTKTHMMKCIQSGIINTVGSDNCTFCTQQKRMGRQRFDKIPNGVNGLEDRMSIVWSKGVKTGLITQNQFVDAVSTSAAKIFNLFPKKGAVRVNSDADLVIWDPNFKHTLSARTHHHNLQYNIFEGLEVWGKALTTFSGGRVVWDNNKFHNMNLGRYIARRPFGYVFSRHHNWTETNNPLHLKVQRDSEGQGQDQVNQGQPIDVRTLQEELRKVREERDRLLQASSSQKSRVNTNACAENTKNQNSHNVQDSSDKSGVNRFYDRTGQFTDTYQALKAYLPQKIFQDVRQILYGIKTQQLQVSQKVQKQAKSKNIQIKSFKINSPLEQTRAPRIVRIAGIQNKIVLPTTQPVLRQKHAIMDRIGQMIQLAAREGANVIGLQQIWTAPFFMCTRQRYPWVQFSEPVNGQSTKFLSKLAQKYNTVIISSILQREQHKGTLHNTAVVIDNHGDILGTQVKGHIPRVGDFNQSSYYMQGQSGHPVFQTQFGRVGVNICYGRHHPLHWLGFGLNGAQIVYNPSATVNGLSQPLWGIQARNAAIANHYFTVGINRVGTQVYPHQFTSGDGKGPKKQFGHFYGSTYVTAPDGSRTPSLSRTSDGVLISEVDLNLCQQIKDKWMFTMTGRHSIYAELLGKFAGKEFVPQRVRKGNKNSRE